jgi:hypothetical protein
VVQASELAQTPLHDPSQPFGPETCPALVGKSGWNHRFIGKGGKSLPHFNESM